MTLLAIFLALFVSFMQLAIEAYNKRFTYIEYDEKEYAVLTTFQDNFIALESEVSDSCITIYRGHVRLIPISDTTLLNRQFSQKHLQ